MTELCRVKMFSSICCMQALLQMNYKIPQVDLNLGADCIAAAARWSSDWSSSVSTHLVDHLPLWLLVVSKLAQVSHHDIA